VFIEPEPDTTARDTIPQTRADSLRMDSLRVDRLRLDSIRLDSIRRTRPDTMSALASLPLNRARRSLPPNAPLPFDPDSRPWSRARLAVERPSRHD